jgi:hypothetical protein
MAPADKLKHAFALSFTTCDRFVQEEGKKQAERGDRSTPSQSMTSLSMFTAFRSDIKFPPIIGSNSYKQNKHLGLCTKIYAPADSESTDTSQQDVSITMNPTLSTSQSIEEPRNILVPTITQSVIPPVMGPPMTINSAPVMPPPPGMVLPPPPMSIGQLLAKSAQIAASGPSQNPGPQSRPEDEEDDQQVVGSYKDTLAMLIGKTQGGPPKENPKEPKDDDFRKKSVLQSILATSGQKVTAGGFFDDEDEDAPSQSLLKKKTKPTEVDSYVVQDAAPVQETRSNKRPNSLLDAILTGESKKEPEKTVDENPFAKRPAKGKKTLFDDDEEDEPKEKDKKRKVDTFLNDDSDDEKDRAKLLKKYGKKESVIEQVAPPKSQTKEPTPLPIKTTKKSALLADSDDEIPLPKKPEKKIITETAPIPTPKVTPKEIQPAPKKTTFDSEEEQVESPPKRISVKNNDFLSKLNAQLGQGPKEGMGLIKSIVQEDGIDQPEENKDQDEPGLLPQNYRSLRGSVDDRGSIKPISDRYFEEADEGKSQFEQKLSMKRTKKSSINNPDDDNSEANSRKQSVLAEVKPPKKEIPEVKPKEVPKPQEPQMLRGKRKDPFASSSGSEDDAPKPPPRKSIASKPQEPPSPVQKKIPEPVKPQEPPVSQPVMLRGNRKKDPFASDSESEEAPKVKASPKVEEPPQPAKKNKLMEETAPKPSPKQENKVESRVSKGATTFKDDSDAEVKPSKAAPAKAGKKKPLLEDSDDDMPVISKPKAGAKPTGSKLFGKDSDDDSKPKKAAAGGKKKLFEDSD